MIHSVIIVDDEKMIREGIKSYISAMKESFSVIDTFEDGRAAIEFLKNNDVDIVITDIRMSEISGLEIIKYVNKNKPDTKTVILSGYNEFEYAKAALENGVEYYISKPTNFKELSGVLSELKEKLEAEKLRREKENSRIERDKELKIFFREEFIRDVYFKQINRESLEQKLKYIDEDYILRDSSFCEFEILVPNYEKYLVQKWKYGGEQFKLAINNYVKQKFLENDFLCVAITQRLQYFCYVLCFNRYVDLNEYIEKIQNILKLMNDEIKELFKLEVSVSIQNFYKTIENFVGGETDYPTELKQENDNVISMAKAYIGKNITKDISLDEVANHVHMSSVYFSRYFKLQTGENFVSYLINLRISLAIELIKERKMQISEISEYVGYTNYSYFSRLFKEKTGYSPKEYARRSEDKKGESRK